MTGSDIEVIARSKIFEGVDQGDIPEVLDKLQATVKSFRKGEVVRHIHEDIDFFGVVIEGTIQTSIPEGDRLQIIMKFGPGSVFAEAVAISVGRAAVQITALTNARILMIKTERFLSMASDPVVSRLVVNLLRDMSGKLMMLNTKIRILGKSRLRGKVSAYLMSLDPGEQGNVVLPLNRSEMASYLGVDRTSLARELRKMQEDGLLAIDGRKVRIVRRETIENAAEGIYDMFDSARTMRQTVQDDPMFGEFLVSKGFPFSVDNPITEVVTFDDVCTVQGLDKESFLEEYAAWKRARSSGKGE